MKPPAQIQSSAGQEELAGDATAVCATSTQPMQLLGGAVSCRTMTSTCSQPPGHTGVQHTRAGAEAAAVHSALGRGSVHSRVSYH